MPLALQRDDIQLIDGVLDKNNNVDADFLSQALIENRSIFAEGFDVQASIERLEQEET